MPIDYKKYNPNFRSEVRPKILARANNCCEFCGVKNHEWVFRGLWNEREAFQYSDTTAFYYPSGEQIDLQGQMIYSFPGKENATAIKIVLTIAHLNHCTTDDRPENLKALCQKCHNIYDQDYRKSNSKKTRNAKKGLIEIGF